MTTEAWAARFDVAAAEWHGLLALERARDVALVERWHVAHRRMRQEQQELVAAGGWRGGPRTLLAAAGMQYRERVMTAGLAWLLTPDGHHGLGPAVLEGLLEHLGLDPAGARQDVRVKLEERREDTIADLVVHGADWTLVVEAKTFSVEGERQLDRLFEHWHGYAAPTFTFLTRTAFKPKTAQSSAGFWRSLTWDQVAGIIKAAAAGKTGAAPGVHEYLTTLEIFYRV